MPPGTTCSPTSKDTTIVSGFIPLSGISPPNRQSAKPLNPMSTKSGEGQSFDTIHVLDPLGDQHLAFAAETAAVLFLGSRRFDHCTHPRFTALVRQQRAKQRLAVDPVGLRSPAPT